MARGAKVRPQSANGFWTIPSYFSKRSGKRRRKARPGLGLNYYAIWK